MSGRVEDARLLRGKGRYVADTPPPGTLQAVFLRADRPGGRLTALDTAAARAVPGVVAILTGADLAQAGIGPLPQDPLPQDAGGRFDRPVPLLIADLVRHAGEPLALVVAETVTAAQDALDLIAPDFVEAEDPPVACFTKSVGQAEATALAIAQAAHRITRQITVPRLHAAPLEPRGCLAKPMGRGVHLRTSTQSPAQLVRPLAALLGLEAALVRVSAGDVGGSFGLKGFLTREEAVVAHAARHLGRPVAWTATRSESFLADHQGRGVTGEVTLALDEGLRFTALQARFTVEAGAYASARSLGLVNNIGGLTGVYDIPLAHAVIEGRTSARPPIAPYRGHGRPEVTLAIESVIDAAARALSVDPVSLRRRNLIGTLPHAGALGFTLDSGDFAGVLDHALRLSDAAGAAARQIDAQARGRLFGRSLILCVEAAGGPVRKPRGDHVALSVAGDGRIILSPGVMSTGQGHETTLTRMVARALEVDEGRIAYVQGDSAVQPEGRGNGGSSGLAVSGPAVAAAIATLEDAAIGRAAAAFGCPPEAITRDGEVFRQTGTNNAATLAQLAGPQGLHVTASFTPPAATFPNGAHACEIEIDPETGQVEILSYTAVEDVGTVLSPALVEGQMQGGITQGISQVLGERIVQDDTGQLLTGSFMDYAMPRATDRIPLRLASHAVPTPVNPLGVKGVGEAGTVGSVAAMMCAVQDAMAGAGVADVQMPATPAALWVALRGRG